jgi:Ca2+-binding RTX toxin-like protein
MSSSFANVKVTVLITCTGAAPGQATYGGSLDLIDLGTGEVTYMGGVFHAFSEKTQPVHRRDTDRRMRPRLSAAFCYQQIDGIFHGPGMVEALGNIVVIPAKDGNGGGDNGGGGGNGGGGSGGADPDDPLRPGGCANELLGSPRPDVLDGESGGDLILALGGADRVRGRDGHDCLVGGSGRDRLLGENGSDRLTGGSGRDRLDGGAGRNAYDAGSGDDRVMARNGHRETVRCGPGDDLARVDADDRVRGCEQVARPS